ncbi:hypothetical protein [Lactobacillus intestinalis]|uniref:hypothetical protein n=1 Tax=Lactobacillus intestinalis TaxID=151781 RepID=UPI001F564C91|nr:hypothetical protein [Lactobacillus intestinalis]
MSKALKIFGISAIVVGALGAAAAVTKVVLDKLASDTTDSDSNTQTSDGTKTDFPKNVVNDSQAELMTSELKDDDKTAEKNPKVNSDSLPKPKQAV